MSGPARRVANMPRIHCLRAFLVLAIACAGAACQSQIPHGEGPVAIGDEVRRAYRQHLQHDLPVVFLVSDDGSASYGMYCPYTFCYSDPLYILAQRRCRELTGKSCKVFAEYGKVTWRGPVAYAPPGPEGAGGQPPSTFEEPQPFESRGGLHD